MFWGLESSFSHIEEDGPLLITAQVLIIVAVIMLHNYIRQAAHRDQLQAAHRDRLFEKYCNNELVVIDSDDEDDEDKTLAGFMPSHLTV